MSICMTRVDYRMIHGQVAGVWIPHFSATKVAIIDDQTNGNDLVKQVLIFAAPHGCTVEFYDVVGGVAAYKEGKFDAGKVIVIFRDIHSARRAYDEGFDYKSLNVGQTPREEGMMHATATVFVTSDDMHDLIDLQNKGVYVYFRQEISKDEVKLDNVVNKLKDQL